MGSWRSQGWRGLKETSQMKPDLTETTHNLLLRLGADVLNEVVPSWLPQAGGIGPAKPGLLPKDPRGRGDQKGSWEKPDMGSQNATGATERASHKGFWILGVGYWPKGTF